MRTTIVVPCYNEADRLDEAKFLDFARQSDAVNLLLVNDGSRDATAAMLAELVRQAPRQLALLDLPQNQGKAEAVRQGVCRAIAEGCEAVGYWDADLATPLEDILSFRAVLARQRSVDLVVGTRLPLLGRDIRRHPLRKILGRVFATTASIALGLKIYDTQCGAKLFRVTPATTQLFTKPFNSRWIFDVELLARWINRAGRGQSLKTSIYEHPLDRWEDIPGSKLKPKHFLQAFHEMASIYWRYLGPLATKWQPLPLAETTTSAPETHDIDHRRAA